MEERIKQLIEHRRLVVNLVCDEYGHDGVVFPDGHIVYSDRYSDVDTTDLFVIEDPDIAADTPPRS